MAKTITLDSVKCVRVQLMKDSATGNLQVYAEYTLYAGTQPVRTVHQEVTARLSSARRTDAQALLDGVSQDVAGFELA